MKKKTTSLFRIGLFVSGLLFFALGIAITIVSDLGISAWDAFSVGLQDHFPISIGTWMNLTSVLLILLGALLKKEPPKFSCMITSIIMSGFVDIFVYLMQDIVLTGYEKVVVYFIGVMFVSIGCGTYLAADLFLCPIDYFMMAIKQRFQTTIRVAMTICEGSGVLCALLVQGPIGIGTLISVVVYGPMIQVVHHWAMQTYNRLQNKLV